MSVKWMWVPWIEYKNTIWPWPISFSPLFFDSNHSHLLLFVFLQFVYMPAAELPTKLHQCLCLYMYLYVCVCGIRFFSQFSFFHFPFSFHCMKREIFHQIVTRNDENIGHCFGLFVGAFSNKITHSNELFVCRIYLGLFENFNKNNNQKRKNQVATIILNIKTWRLFVSRFGGEIWS